jgi:hypothetical protein
MLVSRSSDGVRASYLRHLVATSGPVVHLATGRELVTRRRRVSPHHRPARVTARFARHDITDQIDAPESSEPAEQNDPTASRDPKLPIDPIESAEPTEPMESTEFFEAMERKEPSDAIDHRDGNCRRFRTSALGVIGVNSARCRWDASPSARSEPPRSSL